MNPLHRVAGPALVSLSGSCTRQMVIPVQHGKSDSPPKPTWRQGAHLSNPHSWYLENPETPWTSVKVLMTARGNEKLVFHLFGSNAHYVVGSEEKTDNTGSVFLKELCLPLHTTPYQPEEDIMETRCQKLANLTCTCTCKDI
jgi:hypothetical protein